MSGWLWAQVVYFMLDSLGLLMLAGKRVRYTWPLITFCVLVNLTWVIVDSALAGHLR